MIAIGLLLDSCGTSRPFAPQFHRQPPDVLRQGAPAPGRASGPSAPPSSTASLQQALYEVRTRYQ